MSIDRRHLEEALARARRALLDSRQGRVHWTGLLSSSALATATAAAALAAVDRGRHAGLVSGGLRWLAEHANGDGGWGDTPLSGSNLPATLLVRCALGICQGAGTYPDAARRADQWIAAHCDGPGPDRIVQAVARLYGDDLTFAAPILATCALAGLLGPGPEGWRGVPQLPFHAAVAPHRMLRLLGLPVVSYALPALIAIGLLRRHHLPPANPVSRWVGSAFKRPALSRLPKLQPPSGGFLEAVPLTAFVAVSLASIGLGRHLVTDKAVGFLTSTVRTDGSWPTDTNLAAWVTSLSIQALSAGDIAAQPGLLQAELPALRRWLLDRQFRRVHPYTAASVGGWAWTDLPGGVPDSDDTAGALLALHALGPDDAAIGAAREGVRWLLGIQNRDGGIPTFCRGWGRLDFDRSSAELTAHCLSAWHRWLPRLAGAQQAPMEQGGALAARVAAASRKALAYLAAAQRADGAWTPLWFGNEHAVGQTNPTYGTSRVLLGLAATSADVPAASAGIDWLLGAQGPDGGWGGDGASPPSIEETALAADALAHWQGRAAPDAQRAARIAQSLRKASDWLLDRTDGGRRFDPAPIGLYFARLWYYEKLYPLIFTVSALGSMLRCPAGSGLQDAAARSRIGYAKG